MTRLTKAEKTARDESELLARIAQHEAEYPVRLMALLEEATQLYNNFELRIISNNYVLYDRNEATYHRLSSEYTFENFEDLKDLEHILWRIREARAEQAVLQNLRENAMAKLTAEERKALGL
jgi:hypothetical protein